MSAAPGAPERRLTAPRPGPRRPRRACRSTPSTTRATCSSARALARPRRASPPASLAKSLLARLGVRGREPRRAHRRGGRAARGADRGRATWTRSTPTRSAASTPTPSAAMVAEIKAAAKVGRLPRRRRRGPRLRRARRTGQPRALGPQARRPPRRGAHEHPGGQGRRDRRRLRPGRPSAAAWPTTRSSPTPSHVAGRRLRAARRPRRRRRGRDHLGVPLVARAAMKPLATLNRPVLETVDLATGEPTVSFKERTDVTAVPAMGVVAEAMVALVLADEALRKFGGDSVDEFARNHAGYLADARVDDLGARARASRDARRPRRPARRRQDRPSARRSPRAGAAPSSTPTTSCSRRRAPPPAPPARRRARRAFRDAEARRPGARRWPRRRGRRDGRRGRRRPPRRARRSPARSRSGSTPTTSSLVARSAASTGRCSAATRPRRWRGCARARDALVRAGGAGPRSTRAGALDEVADLVEASAAVCARERHRRPRGAVLRRRRRRRRARHGLADADRPARAERPAPRRS